VKRGLPGTVVACLLVSTAPAAAQGLSDYDYEDLSFRGIGLDVGYIWPNDVEDTESFGLRVDLGYLGPGIRILPRVGYWSSALDPEEVARLESRVVELVEEQNPGAPPLTLDLGRVTWADVSVGTDAQFVWLVPYDILTYAGLGVAVHFRNGSGGAIHDTFIEDLLDSTAAGANVHGGLEVPVGTRLRIYGDARYELAGDVRFFGIRAGVQFLFQDPAPGERRIS
jgi:hypothetical protein